MEVKFDMTTRQKTIFGYLQAAHAQDFLLVIPIDELGQHMLPIEQHIIFKYHLMILLFYVDNVCHVVVRNTWIHLGTHIVHIIVSVYDSNIHTAFLWMSCLIYFDRREYKYSCKFLDRPSRRQFDTQTNKYFGVRLSKKKTCMC